MVIIAHLRLEAEPTGWHNHRKLSKRQRLPVDIVDFSGLGKF